MIKMDESEWQQEINRRHADLIRRRHDTDTLTRRGNGFANRQFEEEIE